MTLPPSVNNQREIVTLTTRDGCVIQAFRGDQIAVAIQQRGEYDPIALDALRGILVKLYPHTSLDVGANIGNHALVIGAHSQRLIAFEPVDFIHALLQRNLESNLGEKATVCPVALSDTNGHCNMELPDDSNVGAFSLSSGAPGHQGLQATTRVGDELLAELDASHTVDFIKIDVEGHEAQAVRGLARTIRDNQPLLMMEWSSEKTIEEFRQGDLLATLFGGYSIYALTRTDSKKLYPRSLVGFFRRLRGKFSQSRWCLTNFDPEKKYSNIFLVPSRFDSIFSALDFRPTQGKH